MSSEVSVELGAIATAIKKCQTVQYGLKHEATQMVEKCNSLGSDWNDEKYKELCRIVQDCSAALKAPISELQRCEVYLNKLHQAIMEYESISLSSGGNGTSTLSSGSQQYSGVGRSGNISDRRYNRMSQAAARNIDTDHANSLRRYCGEGYRDMNGTLRGNMTRELYPDYAATVQGDIDNLTDTLNQHQLGRNMTLYRGVNNPNFMIGDNWQNMTVEELNEANVGRVFHDEGFCSTSVSPNGAGNFSQSWTGATMIIQAPADANGMCVGSFNNHRDEREILLQRGSNFRIDGITRDNFGNCTIRATLIGRG
ncbi:MAG: hypothetical protein J6V80_01650 [Clostridia bacterium]|nr:hypothetical protein [Clostridia bacterium]